MKTKISTFSAAIILGLCFFAQGTQAANHYIRAGATGANNGSSWTDAWTSFSSVTWTRGDTYYLAGGTYNEDITIPSRTGTSWITIKKANPSDNSGDAGWDSSYASNQAAINGKLVSLTGYVEIDGVTGSGTTGHGIRIHPSTSVSVVTFGNGTGPYHIYHVDAEGPGFSYGSSGVDGIYYNVGTKGFHVSNCYIHEIPRNGVDIGTSIGTSWSDYGMLFENNVIERTGGVGLAYPDIHGQGMQIGYASTDAYLIIRNNVFKNIIGSAMIAYLGGSASHTYSRIYNNVFYITDLDTYWGVSPGVIWTNNSGGAVTDYFYIYNNTFFGIGDDAHTSAMGRIALMSSATITTAEAKNNLWMKSRLPWGGTYLGITASSNNSFYDNNGSSDPGDTETADPFINSAAYDFHLKSTANAVDSGVNLNSIFTTDKDGILRPQGSAWDVGAYEYESGYNPDTTAPVAPSGLSVQ